MSLTGVWMHSTWTRFIADQSVCSYMHIVNVAMRSLDYFKAMGNCWIDILRQCGCSSYADLIVILCRLRARMFFMHIWGKHSFTVNFKEWNVKYVHFDENYSQSITLVVKITFMALIVIKRKNVSLCPRNVMCVKSWISSGFVEGHISNPHIFWFDCWALIASNYLIFRWGTLYFIWAEARGRVRRRWNKWDIMTEPSVKSNRPWNFLIGLNRLLIDRFFLSVG